MALELNFSFSTSCDCKTMVFEETTGSYNSVSNLTGWETASTTNPGTGDATAATLTVTNPAGTAYTVDLLTDYSFPKSDNSSVALDMSNFGGTAGDKPVDGLYIVEYTVVTDSGDPAGVSTYTKKKEELFYCNAQCCVHSMLSKLDLQCDTCDRDKKDNAIFAYALLQNLKYSASCGTKTNFDLLITMINRLCDATSCESCG